MNFHYAYQFSSASDLVTSFFTAIQGRDTRPFGVRPTDAVYIGLKRTSTKAIAAPLSFDMSFNLALARGGRTGGDVHKDASIAPNIAEPGTRSARVCLDALMCLDRCFPRPQHSLFVILVSHPTIWD